MDPRPPDRFEELLTRAFDGETTPSEREELAALADAEPRLAALAELRDALRAALAVPGPVDVAGEVMGILAEDAGWGLGGAIREAVGGPVDVADAVMAGVDEAAWAPIGAAIAEAVRIEIDVADAVMAEVDADDGWLGEALRDATARPVDVWAGVADAIGAERDAVHGWDEVAAPLRAAFAAIPKVDVADGVMAAITRGEAEVAHGEAVEILRAETRGGAPKMPLWASLGGPLLAFAAAAALLFTVLPPPGPPRPADGAAVQLATVNDAQVEEISAAQDVVVQVMQFEDGGPTFILVDDPSGSGVPL